MLGNSLPVLALLKWNYMLCIRQSWMLEKIMSRQVLLATCSVPVVCKKKKKGSYFPQMLLLFCPFDIAAGQIKLILFQKKLSYWQGNLYAVAALGWESQSQPVIYHFQWDKGLFP